MKVFYIIWDYRFLIMLVVSIILYAINDWNGFKRDVYNYMLRAKSMAKDGLLKTGKEQEEWVINKIYERAPKAWVSFIGKEKMQIIIKKLYDTGLDLLDDGKLNSSI